jgi:hypothetical protein
MPKREHGLDLAPEIPGVWSDEAGAVHWHQREAREVLRHAVPQRPERDDLAASVRGRGGGVAFDVIEAMGAGRVIGWGAPGAREQGRGHRGRARQRHS